MSKFAVVLIAIFALSLVPSTASARSGLNGSCRYGDGAGNNARSTATCWKVQRVGRHHRRYRVVVRFTAEDQCGIVARGRYVRSFRTKRAARKAVARGRRAAKRRAITVERGCSVEEETSVSPPPLQHSPPPAPPAPAIHYPAPPPSAQMCVDGAPYLTWSADGGQVKLGSMWGGCYRPGIDAPPRRPADPGINPLRWSRNQDGSLTRPLDPTMSGGIASQTCRVDPAVRGFGYACGPDHSDPPEASR